MKSKLVIATRKSPLALRQTELVVKHLSIELPNVEFQVLGVVTTGDRQKGFSLEKEGGKGLFTKEIEEALLANEADLAVHSAKDLPTKSPEGLVIAGYLKREDPSDVLILKSEIKEPKIIATGSPRRREQLKPIFPNAEFKGFRGNVHTRLKKILDGEAEATVLAAAGLNRLGIADYEGLIFEKLPIQKMVPAVGQGAISIQCRRADYDKFQNLFDLKTRYAVDIERLFLASLEGGCHAGFSGLYDQGQFYVFHPKMGYQVFQIDENLSRDEIKTLIEQIVKLTK